MKPTYLFINHRSKTEFGETAQTNTLEYFYKNLKAIGSDYEKSFLEAYKETGKGMIDLQILGRYITLIQLDANETNPQMIFFDTENDEEKAIGVATTLMFSNGDGKMNEKYMEHFMNKFRELQPLYDTNYSLVELAFSETQLN